MGVKYLATRLDCIYFSPRSRGEWRSSPLRTYGPTHRCFAVDQPSHRAEGSKLWPRGEPGPQGIRYSPLVSWLLIIATCRKHVMGTPSLQTGCRLDSIRSLIPTNILLSPGGICRRRLDCLHIE